MGFWVGVLWAVIAGGLLSRAVRTGWVAFDKYLGDALYAVMVYAILRLAGRVRPVGLWAVVTMAAIECFQLTGIPAGMVRSDSFAMKIAGRLLGTEFGWLDLLAYAVGIGCVAMVDGAREKAGRPGRIAGAGTL